MVSDSLSPLYPSTKSCVCIVLFNDDMPEDWWLIYIFVSFMFLCSTAGCDQQSATVHLRNGSTRSSRRKLLRPGSGPLQVNVVSDPYYHFQPSYGLPVCLSVLKAISNAVRKSQTLNIYCSRLILILSINNGTELSLIHQGKLLKGC